MCPFSNLPSSKRCSQVKGFQGAWNVIGGMSKKRLCVINSMDIDLLKWQYYSYVYIQEILIHSLACINCWSKWLGYLREQMDNELCTCGVYNQMKGNREGSKSIINKYINSGSKSITNKYINWGGDLGINVD